jgi:ribosomal protein L40E
MNEHFAALTQKMVQERGKDILDNGKLTKALLADYAHGEYKSEINLFCKTIELGYPQKIRKADNIEIIKAILSRQLTEENFIVEKMAAAVVSLLISLIKDVKYTGEITEKNISKPHEKHPKQARIVSDTKPASRNKPASGKPAPEVDTVKRVLEIWICGRCYTHNDSDQDYCKKCGKEFNPPMINYSEKKAVKIRACSKFYLAGSKRARKSGFLRAIDRKNPQFKQALRPALWE